MKKKKFNFKNEYILLLILVLTFVVMTLLSKGKFLRISNIKSMAFQMPELGLLAIAMMAAVLTGGINLSIATTATLSGIISAYVLTSSFAQSQPILAILLSVLVSVASALVLGIVNGFFIAIVGAAPMLVTLGTTTLFEGIGLNLTKGGAISGFPIAFSFIGNASIFGIPFPVILYLIFIIISYYLLEKSKWGIEVHMLGSNDVATRFSGVNNTKVIFKIYMFSAFMSSIAGLIMNSRYNSAKTDYGSSYVMQAITAVVLGGTSIYGGEGTVIGTVLAVAIIQFISTGLNIIGLNRNLVDIIIGAILVLVLIIKVLSKKASEKSLIKARKLKTVKK